MGISDLNQDCVNSEPVQLKDEFSFVKLNASMAQLVKQTSFALPTGPWRYLGSNLGGEFF